MTFRPLENDLVATASITRSQQGDVLWEPGVRDIFTRTFELGPGLYAAAAFIPDDPANLEVFEIREEGTGPPAARVTQDGALFRSEFLTGATATDLFVRADRDPDGPGGPVFDFTTPEIVINIDDAHSGSADLSLATRLAPGDTLSAALNGWNDQDSFWVDAPLGLHYTLEVSAGPTDLADFIALGLADDPDANFFGFDGVLGGSQAVSLSGGDTRVFAMRLHDPDLARPPENADYEISVSMTDEVESVIATKRFGEMEGLRLLPGQTLATILDGSLDTDTLSFAARAGVTYSFAGSAASPDRVEEGTLFRTAAGATPAGDPETLGVLADLEDTLVYTADRDRIVNLSVSQLGGEAAAGRVLVTLTSDQRNFVGAEAGETLTANGRNNKMEGLGGRDVLSGLGGRDRVEGGPGNDRLLGGAGNDRLFGDAGRDVLLGQPGADRLFGGGGADRLSGGRGRDDLKGAAGRDRLDGGGGRDRLDGGGGRDRLDGGGGRDRLDGGAGRDVLEGGAGRDVFVQSGGRDRVVDWQNGRDMFEISRGADRFAELEITQRGDDVVIDTEAGGFRVEDARTRQFDASDFDFV